LLFASYSSLTEYCFFFLKPDAMFHTNSIDLYNSSIDASNWYYDSYDNARFRCRVNQRSDNLRYETCHQLDFSSSSGGGDTTSSSPTSSSLMMGNCVTSGASGQPSSSPVLPVDFQNTSSFMTDNSYRRFDSTANFYRCAVACDADVAAMRRHASSNVVAVDNPGTDEDEVGMFFSLDVAADRQLTAPVHYDSPDVGMRPNTEVSSDRTATICHGDLNRYTSSCATHDVGQVMPAAVAAQSCDSVWNGSVQFNTSAIDAVTSSSTDYFGTNDVGRRWQTVDVDRRPYVSTWSHLSCRHAEDQLPAFGVTFRGGSPVAVVPHPSAVRGDVGGGKLLHETTAETGYRRPSEGGALVVEPVVALPPGGDSDGRAWATLTATPLNGRDDFAASFTSLPVVPHHVKHHRYDRCSWQTPMPLDISSSPQQMAPHVDIVLRQPVTDGAANGKRLTAEDKPAKRLALRNRQDPEMAATTTTTPFCWEPTTSCHRLQLMISVIQNA
jgi:hypothetical protein